jgi:hypothetical protein
MRGRRADAPQVFDGADVYISGQKNIQVHSTHRAWFGGGEGLYFVFETTSGFKPFLKKVEIPQFQTTKGIAGVD